MNDDSFIKFLRENEAEIKPENERAESYAPRPFNQPLE